LGSISGKNSTGFSRPITKSQLSTIRTRPTKLSPRTDQGFSRQPVRVRLYKVVQNPLISIGLSTAADISSMVMPVSAERPLIFMKIEAMAGLMTRATKRLAVRVTIRVIGRKRMNSPMMPGQ